jgi:hypothetical protein
MSAIDDLNYANDPRNCKADAKIFVEDADGIEREIPTTWGVCPVCRGKGTHVNPAIDCNGLTGEDFADDPDFADAYRNGDYDELCRRCRGRTTARVVDVDACEPHLLALYYADVEADQEYDAERLAEIRAGA